MEQPEPAETLEDLTTDDGRQTGCGIEDEVDDGDAKTSLVHKVHVAHGRDDEGFER